MNDLEKFERDGRPWCNVCNQYAEEFGVETPVETVWLPNRIARYAHTGEIIVTVKCHGEIWKESNWRGRLV
jgi:hypothetical protein